MSCLFIVFFLLSFFFLRKASQRSETECVYLCVCMCVCVPACVSHDTRISNLIWFQFRCFFSSDSFSQTFLLASSLSSGALKKERRLLLSNRVTGHAACVQLSKLSRTTNPSLFVSVSATVAGVLCVCEYLYL